MTFPSDDLTPLLTRRGGGGGVSYASGVIRSWNPTTFANVVEVRGTVFRNLPVLAGTDALTYTTGDVVGLISYDPTGSRGATTWAIVGRWVIPGSGSAERIIQFLQTSLARQLVDELVQELLTSESGQELAAFVLANRVHHAAIEGHISVTGTSFQEKDDLEVTADITDSGKAVALIGADITVESGEIGYMALEVSGATTQAAPAGDGAVLYVVNVGATGISMSASKVITFDNLNPGENTFSARYAAGATGNADFFDRTLTVFAF